jgi:3-phytase
MKKLFFIFYLGAVLLFSCNNKAGQNLSTSSDTILQPAIITESVNFDTDDPAIWINPMDSSKSLILGTDKDADGALFVFDLQGKIIPEKVVHNLKRPNNVDVEYGLMLSGKMQDIAVTSERATHRIRIFSVPSMQAIDNGGIEVFLGEAGEMERDLMGIALYKNPVGKIYVIVGRKMGPEGGAYLWQYELQDDGAGKVKATLCRKFGKFSGKKEIEAIAVDDKLGFVYYSDEGFGIRKYYADPTMGDEELGVFGTTGFSDDHEGISIFESTDSTGYILVSDQGRNHFKIYPREGCSPNKHEHPMLKSVHLATLESDGSEIVSVPLNATFQKGLLVAMSTDKTFHYYRWEDIFGTGIKTCSEVTK